MPLIERISLTNQAINTAKTINFTASPADYEQVQLRVWLYDLAAVSAAKTASCYITRGGSGILSRFIINPTITTAFASICLTSDLFILGAGDILRTDITGSSSDTANVDIVAEIWGIPDLSALITTVDTVVDSIDARLPSDPADESLLEAYISTETSGLATSAALGMVSSVVNTLPSAAEIDTQLSGTHGSGTWGNGSGSTSTTVTVNDGVNPIDGVDVWISTDSAGTNVIARGSTGALGTVVFMLDAGTYYAWKQLAGYDFTNPQSFTVS